MTDESSVALELRSQPRFGRTQLGLRLALALVLGWAGITAGWLACVLCATLPVIAAVAASSLGGARFLDDGRGLSPATARTQ